MEGNKEIKMSLLRYLLYFLGDDMKNFFNFYSMYNFTEMDKKENVEFRRPNIRTSQYNQRKSYPLKIRSDNIGCKNYHKMRNN
jgi:hypothetical protein